MSEVKLVAITQPYDLDKNGSEIYEPGKQTPMSVDEFIAYVARVSNPSNQNNTETAPKLLSYLIRNHHWSPFEMVHLVMEIKTTRDIGRQILRHRSFSFQEFSQRYANPTDMGFVYREARLQDTKNRQNSIEVDDITLQEQWKEIQNIIVEKVQHYYNWAIGKGIAKEQARVILPEGLTSSTMYMAGTLRSWIHYCQLRMSPGTQKEHREIALKAHDIIVQKFPSLGGLIYEENK